MHRVQTQYQLTCVFHCKLVSLGVGQFLLSQKSVSLVGCLELCVCLYFFKMHVVPTDTICMYCMFFFNCLFQMHRNMRFWSISWDVYFTANLVVFSIVILSFLGRRQFSLSPKFVSLVCCLEWCVCLCLFQMHRVQTDTVSFSQTKVQYNKDKNNTTG